MSTDPRLYESDKASDLPDPDEVPIRNRKVVTQPYDVGVESMIHQIDNGTIFLRPISERPEFQRRYVWNDKLASRLIESILLKVPIPPCYLSQNDDFEQDVIDGQQRIYSIYRFCKNHFKLAGLEVLSELNGKSCHELDTKLQRQINTHTQRFVLITNESHPEVKFEVFERLNTNTVPLTAQELRNCVYRGALLSLLKELVLSEEWLAILRRKEPDKRMRDEELLLRFFAFKIKGLNSYKTPQKHWLNEAAKDGRNFSDEKIQELRSDWNRALGNSLIWFSYDECFRSSLKSPPKAINRAIFDLVTQAAVTLTAQKAASVKTKFRKNFEKLLDNKEFQDLISRSVDHKTRTIKRFELWEEAMAEVL